MMNKNNAGEYLPYVQALADGKVIQHRLLNSDTYYDMDDPRFDGKPEQYRVKPDPMVIYVNVYADGEHLGFNSKHSAENTLGEPERRAVKFIDVTDES